MLQVRQFVARQYAAFYFISLVGKVAALAKQNNHRSISMLTLNPPMSEKNSPALLLVDDDTTFCGVMSNAMRRRGYSVFVAHNAIDAKALAEKQPPDYALVDLKMPGKTGLRLIQHLHDMKPEMRIVMLTGFASIATAVEAIKLGATNYLSKPANADEVALALNKVGSMCSVSLPNSPFTVKQVEWEHIQRVLMEHDGNITAAARALNMHRRSLQRKLARNPACSDEEIIRD